MSIKSLRHVTAAILTAGLIGPAIAQAETSIPPMPQPIPGSWQDVSHLKENLPLVFDALWFEPESFSLIHVQTSDTQEPLSHDVILAVREHMEGTVSFWGEPPHANAAQFFANQVYLQPSSYDALIGEAIDRLYATGQLLETPGIWELPEAKGNPHLFYHGQLTPRIALAVLDGTLHVGEAYAPHRKTRNDFIQSGSAEAIVLEVQTLDPAIAEAIEKAGLPAWLTSERFAYCAVLHAPRGFSDTRREHIWLASPLGSGIDCDAILAGFGLSMP